ncbi:MAG: CDP-alcohol phosphatidyltransferase family protein [Desulfobacterium sp.]|nr:CDP-alcohol phosphatidyltransferase family protein [Desulfobacterium sp.]MBU3946685.1 CDP-alcohol phosphatidyltransferase family protein [Pseudomonadota bacterium]MBU4009621.1 CDP-alcohol phosphatidyltransferase family protein [Pseudomonadota bacterium]MBU4035058.1 CDP-alcohol phosphatidyltransferase family protein [Pseudomonadota bacterium]
MNIPNIITIIRILLVPLFIIFLIRDLFVSALIIFAIAGLSDGLDGFIARYFNQRTELGAYLDPIADKLLIISAYVSLAVIKIIPGWLAVIVITRDVIILLGIAVFSITDITIEIKPSLVSKCTTVAQLGTVVFILFNPTVSDASLIKYYIYWATAGLSILSGFHYIYKGMNILQEASPND